MLRTLSKPIGLFCTVLLAGCAGVPETSHPMYESVAPISYPTAEMTDPSGSLFVGQPRMALFEDVRALQVGDIVTVLLSESTNAGKSADTTLDRDATTNIEDPILGGQTRSIGNDFNLQFQTDSESSFSGQSSSQQSNQMQGTIAVTVANVLPNGNLYVQGEKWIHINQGNEYIRLRGIIRPVDISTNNTILSTQVADARLSYSGTGPTAEVNSVGWMTRFFMSPIWPF